MAKSYRILVVDDDPDILELLSYNLGREGFKIKVIENSKEAVGASIHFRPDLIILDIMMPTPSGIEICKQLRGMPTFRDTYIFFLTARSEHYYQDAAYDTGGDDFIEKIIGLRALTNKVVTVLKDDFVIRKSVSSLVTGNLVIYRKTALAYLKGVPINFSKPEFDLLFFFAQNPKKIISVDNLISNIWGSEVYSANSSVEFYLENIAKKLGDKWMVNLGNGRYKFSPH
jgi:two-component system, OmpR family, alkaline phosphatase synthesis response regulator PhoP